MEFLCYVTSLMFSKVKKPHRADTFFKWSIVYKALKNSLIIHKMFSPSSWLGMPGFFSPIFWAFGWTVSLYSCGLKEETGNLGSELMKMQKLKDKMWTHTGVFPQQAHVNSEWRAVSLIKSKPNLQSSMGRKLRTFRGSQLLVGWFLFLVFFLVYILLCV